MIAQVETKTYTAQEYLELEVNSLDRHEFINGEIILMAGGTPDHNEIAINLGGALKLALKGKPYRTFSSDQRLWVPQLNNYTYPDLMVVAKPIELQSGRTDTITTASADKTVKFWNLNGREIQTLKAESRTRAIALFCFSAQSTRSSTDLISAKEPISSTFSVVDTAKYSASSSTLSRS